MRWMVVVPAALTVYYDAYGTEDPAHAEAIERIRAWLRAQDSKVSVEPAYRRSVVSGTPEPDPRD